MSTLPGLIIMVDPKSEHICVKEAKRLGIPVVGIVDTNCDPDDVDVCIPANDDAIRSVKLILNALADAIIEGRDGVTLRDMNASDEEVSMDAVVKSTVTNKIADEKEQPAEEIVEENK
jgi:small subunit ribosomal protein S2